MAISEATIRREADKLKSFEEYSDKYENMRMERRDGILQVTFHTDGGSFKWGEVPHRELGYAFADIGSDPENKVVIMTGTGDDFLAGVVGDVSAWRVPPPGSNKTWTVATLWDKTYWEGQKILMNLLDIAVPTVSAINGPALIHPEMPVLCDVVLASENAVFKDSHYRMGYVPGDGDHVIWQYLLGPNRAKYFLLFGRELLAKEALDLGVVNEVLPSEKLLPRAWELAEELAKQPPLTLRYSKVVLNLHIKRLLQDMLGYGLALEGMSALDVAISDG